MIRQTKRVETLEYPIAGIGVVDTWDITVGDKRGMEWIRVT